MTSRAGQAATKRTDSASAGGVQDHVSLPPLDFLNQSNVPSLLPPSTLPPLPRKQNTVLSQVPGDVFVCMSLYYDSTQLTLSTGVKSIVFNQLNRKNRVGNPPLELGNRSEKP